MNQQTPMYWRSYQKFYLVLLLGGILFAASLTGSLNGDLKAGIVSFIGLLMVMISFVVIIRRGVWVEINELGVTYRNLFGTKTLKWKDISQSYIVTIKLTTTVSIKSTSGKTVSLPITGSKAIVISDTINSRLNET